MRFVELTEVRINSHTGRLEECGTICVNLDNVRVIQRNTKHNQPLTEIFFNSPPCYWTVKETPKEILVNKTVIGG